jgi:integrase
MHNLVLKSSNEITIHNVIDEATDFIQEINCKNSKIAYDADMSYWNGWYNSNGLSLQSGILKEHIILFIMQHAEGMPASIETILIAQGLKKPGIHKMSTIERRIATISRFMELRKLPNPCHDKDIRILLRKLTDKHGCSKAWGKAITLDVLNTLIDTCDEDLRGIRDKAILLFGFSTGGRRRSEIIGATYSNLSENADGTYIYNLNVSKTNRNGKDDKKPIVGRAAIALRHWLKLSNIQEGYIFRGIRKGNKLCSQGLEGKQIDRVIKSRCSMAGLNPKDYTAHSLRSGFVTEGGKRGKPIGDIMHLTGHRSMAEVMRYYQSGSVLNNSAAYLAG